MSIDILHQAQAAIFSEVQLALQSSRHQVGIRFNLATLFRQGGKRGEGGLNCKRIKSSPTSASHSAPLEHVQSDIQPIASSATEQRKENVGVCVTRFTTYSQTQTPWGAEGGRWFERLWGGKPDLRFRKCNWTPTHTVLKDGTIALLSGREQRNNAQNNVVYEATSCFLRVSGH